MRVTVTTGLGLHWPELDERTEVLELFDRVKVTADLLVDVELRVMADSMMEVNVPLTVEKGVTTGTPVSNELVLAVPETACVALEVAGSDGRGYIEDVKVKLQVEVV